MKKQYLEKLAALKKKLDKINKKIWMTWIDEWYTEWDVFNKINKMISEYYRADKLQFLPEEYEYLTFSYVPFTYDWETRYRIVLRSEDEKNLNLYLNQN